MSSFYDTRWASDMMATARSKADGKPIANNTRLYDNGDGSYRLRLHNTDIITYNADGTWTLNAQGWKTVTTAERVRAYSPVHLNIERGEWYVWLEPRENDPRPQYVGPPIPAPFERPADYEQTDDDNQWHDYRTSYRIAQRQRVYDEMMESFSNNVAVWRTEREVQFKARKAYLKADAEWVDRNRIPFYDGITVNESGYAPRLRADGPSPAKLRKHEREVKRVKKAIDTYVNDYIDALKAGMPMPGGGDCWFCLFRNTDTGETWGDMGDNSHLIEHMKDRYYVPSLAVNAMRERGYRDVGIYMFLDMDQDTNMMGKSDGRYDNVKRDITKYMSKRLVPNAPTE